MTEEEAKGKWCPQVRFHNGLDGDVYCSRPCGVATDNSAMCIASDCMMWTWDLLRTNPESRGNGLIEPTYKRSDTEGHCGLINK